MDNDQYWRFIEELEELNDLQCLRLGRRTGKAMYVRQRQVAAIIATILLAVDQISEQGSGHTYETALKIADEILAAAGGMEPIP